MKKLILSIYLMAGTSVAAQHVIVVKDSTTLEPIPYVSVWFGNNSGGYTNEGGTIDVPDWAEQLRFSHICYETKSITKDNDPGNTVLLAPKSINLSEINISAKASKQARTKKIGYIKEKAQTRHSGANGFEMALFIPYDSEWIETPYIHSIFASLDYSTRIMLFNTIESPIYTTLRFDLRLPDTKTGAPRNESIINGGILYEPGKKVGKDGVKLSNPIPFPETGVFVVLEWITTAMITESESLIPSLNMTLKADDNRTWNKKTYREMDWKQIKDEPIYQNEQVIQSYKGMTPCAMLGLTISE